MEQGTDLIVGCLRVLAYSFAHYVMAIIATITTASSGKSQKCNTLRQTMSNPKSTKHNIFARVVMWTRLWSTPKSSLVQPRPCVERLARLIR